mmetsp:Transcript_43542/g.78629  ORF Transcript_43542/g.78629 Transcript_43542/m.78629 type:complete len:245 (+) Transcript_43542:176-910(+)
MKGRELAHESHHLFHGLIRHSIVETNADAAERGMTLDSTHAPVLGLPSESLLHERELHRGRDAATPLALHVRVLAEGEADRHARAILWQDFVDIEAARTVNARVDKSCSCFNTAFKCCQCVATCAPLILQSFQNQGAGVDGENWRCVHQGGNRCGLSIGLPMEHHWRVGLGSIQQVLAHDDQAHSCRAQVLAGRAVQSCIPGDLHSPRKQRGSEIPHQQLVTNIWVLQELQAVDGVVGADMNIG